MCRLCEGPVESLEAVEAGVSGNTAQSKVWRNRLDWTFGAVISDEDSQSRAHRFIVACFVFLYEL